MYNIQSWHIYVHLHMQLINIQYIELIYETNKRSDIYIYIYMQLVIVASFYFCTRRQPGCDLHDSAPGGYTALCAKKLITYLLRLQRWVKSTSPQCLQSEINRAAP